MERARIVTLCGSLRFAAELAEVAERLSAGGCVVLRPESVRLPGYDWDVDPDGVRERLGALHLEKVRLADEVVVVDPGGYLGESTTREIALAESLGTPVRFSSRET